MRLALHVPDSVTAPDEWDQTQRTRLLQVVRRALTDAASAVQSDGARVELVEGPVRSDAQTGAAPGRGPARERRDPSRLRGRGDRYGIPGYDDGSGEEVQVPIRDDANHPEANQVVNVITGQGDEIHGQDFPKVPVIQSQGNIYVFAGGQPYVIAGNLARALSWGAYLFGGLGFAVLHRNTAGPNGPFHVVPLTEPLSTQDVGGLGEKPTSDEGLTFSAVQRWGRFISPRGYATVAIVTRDGTTLLSPLRGDLWNYRTVARALHRIPRAAQTVDPADVQVATSSLTQAAQAQHDDDAVVNVIVNMDHTVFAAIPWETREHYLELLIRAWTFEREQIAIVEIIRGTRNVAELEAIFARLREAGLYEQLFGDLHGQVYEMLQALAEYRPAGTLNWRYLMDVLGFNPIPTSSPDPVRDLERAAQGLLEWLRSTWEGIVFLITKPDQVIEGMGHMVEFLWTLNQASYGDPQAVTLVNRMLREAAHTAAKAIRGMEYAEELGTTYGARTKSSGIGEDIMGRLKAMLACEVLSWFIGIGEIKAAISTVGTLPERIAALAEVIRGLRLAGRVAEAGAEAGRLERVLAALAHGAELADKARAVRLVELLPDEHIALLNRLALTVDLPEGAGMDALRAALHAHHELAEAADYLANIMAVADRLEARAAQVGGVTADMAAGFRTMLLRSSWSKTSAIELIDHIPAANLEDFMRTLTFVAPDRFERWGVDVFKELAKRPSALAFIREAGSDLVDLAYRRSGGWEGLDRFLEGLALKRDQIGNPTEYQRFLDRLRHGDSTAFDEVAETLHARQLKEATQAGRTAAYTMDRLRQAGHHELLDDLEALQRGNPAGFNELASELAQLTNRELDGLEQLARYADQPVDWSDVLAWPAADRADFLGLMSDVAPNAAGGLEDVIHGILGRNVATAGADVTGVQGSWGQLYAARDLIRRGARNLRFELTQATGGLRRDVDIIADLGAGRVHVEVKTNLTGAPSFDREQILRDLVNHAPTGYDDLMYMYHPSTSEQLPGLGRRMLDLFDTPELRQLFRQRGLDLDQARGAFQRWLDGGGLTTYAF